MTDPNKSPLQGLAVMLVVFAGLLAVAERTGLPQVWVRGFLCIIAFIAVISTIILARTKQEAAFFAQIPLMSGTSAAVVIASTLVVTSDLVLAPSDPTSWLAIMVGNVAGFALGFGLKRWQHLADARALRNAPKGATIPSVIRGLGLILLGGTMAMTAMPPAAAEAMRIFATSTSGSAALIILASLLIMLFGGARASFAFAGFVSTLAIVIMGSLIAIGMVSLGPLPLPDLSGSQTLLAIADARSRWGVTSPLHLTEWPSLGAIGHGDTLRTLVIAALLAAGITASFTPAAPAYRRGAACMTMALLIMLPLAIIAIGGFAIEAAAVQFVGTPIARANSGMVEASRLGLIEICRAMPDTTEAIRLACGISPRDPKLFDWSHIRPTQAFTTGGLSAALDHSSTINLLAGSFRLWLLTAATALGLWTAARGLGGDILAHNRTAAGLASLRLGLTRLAALGLAAALAWQWNAYPVPALWLPGGAAAGAALVLFHEIVTAFRKRTAASTAASPPGPPTRARPQRRKPVSANGEPA